MEERDDDFSWKGKINETEHRTIRILYILQRLETRLCRLAEAMGVDVGQSDVPAKRGDRYLRDKKRGYYEDSHD